MGVDPKRYAEAIAETLARDEHVSALICEAMDASGGDDDAVPSLVLLRLARGHTKDAVAAAVLASRR